MPKLLTERPMVLIVSDNLHLKSPENSSLVLSRLKS